jgi:hypothetical protein
VAKLFKQLPALGQGVPAKPLSELDFLDLLEKPMVSPNPLPAPVPVVESVPAANTGEVSKVASTTGKTGVTGNALPFDSSDNSSNTNSRKPSEQTQVASKSGNTGNAGNPDKSSQKGKPGKSVPLTSSAEPLVAADAGDVRQTLILSRNHMEQLRDLVHARRTAGEYAYSQKQAIREALDLLFAANGIAAPRPDQAREREQQHRELIKKGRQLRATKELPASSSGDS